MGDYEVRRLARGDEEAAGDMFAMMADVFDEDSEQLGKEYIDGLLGRDDFWAIAAFAGPHIVGGLTAHTLPMTRSRSSEVFIYDLAVHRDHRRQGVAGGLVRALREAASQAGIHETFVLADDEDLHALDFYRAQGAIGSPVTCFVFRS
jgi:Acetyltransferases